MLRLARVASSPVFIIVSGPWCFHVTARQAPCPHHCTSTPSLYTYFNITHFKPSASRHVSPRRIITHPHNVQSWPEQRRRRVLRQRHKAREANARKAPEVCDLSLRPAIDLPLTLSAGTTSPRFSAFSSAPNHTPSDLLSTTTSSPKVRSSSGRLERSAGLSQARLPSSLTTTLLCFPPT